MAALNRTPELPLKYACGVHIIRWTSPPLLTLPAANPFRRLLPSVVLCITVLPRTPVHKTNLQRYIKRRATPKGRAHVRDARWIALEHHYDKVIRPSLIVALLLISFESRRDARQSSMRRSYSTVQ